MFIDCAWCGTLFEVDFDSREPTCCDACQKELDPTQTLIDAMIESAQATLTTRIQKRALDELLKELEVLEAQHDALTRMTPRLF